MSLQKPSLISAVAHTPSLLNVFSVGADRVIRHKAIQPESSWNNLTSTRTLNSPPAAVSWGPNRLGRVRAGDRQLDATLRVERDAVGRESALGGIFDSDPAVASRAPDRLDVFALGADNSMQHLRWNGTGWVGWVKIGDGIFNSGPAVWEAIRTTFWPTTVTRSRRANQASSISPKTKVSQSPSR
jgi:hypothetical protein